MCVADQQIGPLSISSMRTSEQKGDILITGVLSTYQKVIYFL